MQNQNHKSNYLTKVKYVTKQHNNEALSCRRDALELKIVFSRCKKMCLLGINISKYQQKLKLWCKKHFPLIVNHIAITVSVKILFFHYHAALKKKKKEEEYVQEKYKRRECRREERPQDHHRQSLIWAQTRG